LDHAGGVEKHIFWGAGVQQQADIKPKGFYVTMGGGHTGLLLSGRREKNHAEEGNENTTKYVCGPTKARKKVSTSFTMRGKLLLGSIFRGQDRTFKNQKP